MDVAVEREETEKLIGELMKMDIIPKYKPSANHVQLSHTGLIIGELV